MYGQSSTSQPHFISKPAVVTNNVAEVYETPPFMTVSALESQQLCTSKGRQGNERGIAAQACDNRKQHDGVQRPRQRRAATSAHIHHGAHRGSCPSHAAKEPRECIANTLTCCEVNTHAETQAT